jgi:aspartate racemase
MSTSTSAREDVASAWAPCTSASSGAPPGGAALCYRTICAEGEGLLGAHAHPEVSVHTPPFVEYVRCLDRGDLAGVGALMLASARKLAAAGADFLVCPDNTIHQAFCYVVDASPLQWLHIAEEVAADAQARGFRRLGIMGTRWLVRGSVYPDALEARGLVSVRPTEDDIAVVHRIIMDELVRGMFRAASTSQLRAVVDRLRADGCDAVVLGCTELPLVLDEANCSLPPLDSTRILARAALRRAAGAAGSGRGRWPGGRRADDGGHGYGGGRGRRVLDSVWRR